MQKENVGIVRAVDRAGRIVLPKEMLTCLGLKPGDLMDISIYQDEYEKGFIIKRADIDTRDDLMESIQKLRLTDIVLAEKLSDVVREYYSGQNV